MKSEIASILLLAAGTAFAGPLDKAWFKGTTDKDPLTYKPGEEMVITVTPMGVEGTVPAGEYFLDWKRTDDFGGFETGRVAFTAAPFVYKAKLDKPGFVRLEARVMDKAGRRTKVFFDGGAGVEPEKLATTPEPKDFDEFWARQFARLDKVPMKADLVPIPCEVANVDLFAVRVDCAGLRPVTGYLSVPKDVAEGKTHPARLTTHGYSGDGCTHRAPKGAGAREIIFDINAHGLKLPAFGATDADTKALRWEVRSHDNTYAFDAKQNADPEVAYFNGMVLRVKRALQYLKTVKGWNGKDLLASGGSQGGLQTIWAAGCGEGVTRAESGITWCCDMAMNNARRARKISSDGWYVPWTESMGYYDAANFAKRIPLTCRTVITRAGIGDYCCPPTGLAKLYNNIPGNKEIHWMQGSQHGYQPPAYEGRDFVRSFGPKGPRRAIFGTGGNDASLAACCRFTGKAHPKTLLFETPAGDDEGTIKRRTDGLVKAGAEVEVIRMWKQKIDPIEVRRKILDADLIWMGSGATEQLLYKIEQYYLEDAFHAAYRNGTVLAGNSAGSLIQAYAGYNDFNDGRYDFIRCMGIIPVYFVPHYQDKTWQQFDARLAVETDPSTPSEGWAVENGAGVFFTDEKPEVRIVTGGFKDRENARAFHFTRKNGKWTKTVVPAVSRTLD